MTTKTEWVLLDSGVLCELHTALADHVGEIIVLIGDYIDMESYSVDDVCRRTLAASKQQTLLGYPITFSDRLPESSQAPITPLGVRQMSQPWKSLEKTECTSTIGKGTFVTGGYGLAVEIEDLGVSWSGRKNVEINFNYGDSMYCSKQDALDLVGFFTELAKQL